MQPHMLTTPPANNTAERRTDYTASLLGPQWINSPASVPAEPPLVRFLGGLITPSVLAASTLTASLAAASSVCGSSGEGGGRVSSSSSSRSSCCSSRATLSSRRVQQRGFIAATRRGDKRNLVRIVNGQVEGAQPKQTGVVWSKLAKCVVDPTHSCLALPNLKSMAQSRQLRFIGCRSQHLLA